MLLMNKIKSMATGTLKGFYEINTVIRAFVCISKVVLYTVAESQQVEGFEREFLMTLSSTINP